MRELRFAVAVVLVCAAAIASNVKSPLTPSRKNAPKRVAVTTASPQARAEDQDYFSGECRRNYMGPRFESGLLHQDYGAVAQW